jgi:hypothetical protein
MKRDVVAVRARQDDRERRAVGVGGDVMFGIRSRTIGGVPSKQYDLRRVRLT